MPNDMAISVTSNEVKASPVGGEALEAQQAAGTLSVVVAVVGSYPSSHAAQSSTSTVGAGRNSMFLALLEPGSDASLAIFPDHLAQDRLLTQQIEDHHLYSHHNFQCERYKRENSTTKHLFSEPPRELLYCQVKECTHVPTPSAFPNLNWTFESGITSFDRAQALGRRPAALHHQQAQIAPHITPTPACDHALRALSDMVQAAVSAGLKDVAVCISVMGPEAGSGRAAVPAADADKIRVLRALVRQVSGQLMAWHWPFWIRRAERALGATRQLVVYDDGEGAKGFAIADE
ncbi:hypothetical protein M406DRAFT_330273 [Cryphonectria parasitica EP155]|uniref:Uncharacterized protein n=1 Tax=Cryphonectria parasitica (strain ATCC 38755 / EP155) TaxID=660469 RepID=A0A9P4Y4S3_CRYP1|nr:uncharacterized protein M406DRAFT_330273 [Cryphonectria parasitica EP155]KAF3766454.1 hypothetical protein M406DRAFT_330273 [Cryphonectria parasitica EP155]